MNDELLFQEVEAVVKKCNQPYGLNHTEVEEALAKIQAWQVNPSNDCLRSRGDFRWQKSCELATSLQALLVYRHYLTHSRVKICPTLFAPDLWESGQN